jgi:hypothetical protein
VDQFANEIHLRPLQAQELALAQAGLNCDDHDLPQIGAIVCKEAHKPSFLIRELLL